MAVLQPQLWIMEILRAFVEHLELCVLSLGISAGIALGLGLLLSRWQFFSDGLIAVFGVFYTVPSLALLALLVPWLGLGKLSAVVALVVYAQYILLRHVVLGLQSIDPYVLETANALGMRPVQTFFKVRMPLALPTWLSGLRISAISTVSIATIAAWINAGGLGTLIFQGIAQNDPAKIVTGAVLIAILALFLDRMIRGFEESALQLAQGHLTA